MTTIFKDPVTINGLAFNNGVADANGCKFYIDQLDGWDETADVQTQVTSFGYSDGVEAANRWPLSEKYLQVGGYITVPSRTAAFYARQELVTNLKADDELVVLRTSPIPQEALCRRASKIEYPQNLEKDGAMRFLFTLMQPWPYKVDPTVFTGDAAPFAGGAYYRTYDPTGHWRTYDSVGHWRVYTPEFADPTSTEPQLITFINLGDSDAYPVFTVHGPLLAGTWYLLHEETNTQLGFTLDLSTGQDLVIDMLNKTAYIGDGSVDYYLDGDWIHASPGTNTYRLISGATDDNAGFSIAAQSTWE